MDDKNDKKDMDDGYSLYTEKIVLSPRVKYRKIIDFIKCLLTAILLLSLAGSMALIVWEYKERMAETDVTEAVFTIEKDHYYADDQYSEDATPETDIKTDYESLLAMLRAKVEDVNKCIVTLDTANYDNEFTTFDEAAATNQSGLVIAHINATYVILTSVTVTDQWSDIVVRLSDSVQVSAEVLSTDTETGIAILSISEENIPDDIKADIQVAMLGNSYGVKQGDMLIVVGRLYGVTGAVDYGTVTNISTQYALDNGYNILDTNLTRTEGDYGFLFNSAGSIVGITTIRDDVTLKAIGISDLKAMLESLINHRDLLYFGIKGQNITSELASKYSLEVGVYVSSLERNSPAYEAGIQQGDIIVAVDGNEALTIQEFNEKLYQCNYGDTMQVTVKRLGKEGYMDVVYDVTVSTR